MEALEFIQKVYQQKHPILFHLRKNHGFLIDEVAELMESFAKQREESLKEEYYFKGLEQGRAEGYQQGGNYETENF